MATALVLQPSPNTITPRPPKRAGSSSPFMPTSATPSATLRPTSPRTSERLADRKVRGYHEAMRTNAPGEPFTRSTSFASSSNTEHASHPLNPVERALDMTSATSHISGPQTSILDGHDPSSDLSEYPTSFSDPGHYASTRPSSISTSPTRRARPSRPLPEIPGPITRRSSYQDAADEIVRKAPSAMSAPPPIPPKSDRRYRSKTVFIVAPSDVSHENLLPHDTVSEPGHSSGNPTTTPSGRTPLRKTYGAHSSSGHPAYSSRLSWADRAHLPLYRNSYPALSVDAIPSEPVPESSRSGTNRLRKTPPRPTFPPSSMSSGPASRIWRALSLRNHCFSADVSTTSTSSSDEPVQLVQRPSDSSSDSHLPSTTRPDVRTYNSGTNSSESHASNSTSSSTSASHTPLTTPESTSPPVSPVIVDSSSQGLYGDVKISSPVLASQFEHGIHVTRKLKKRRPLDVPSAMAHSSTNLSLGRSTRHTARRSSMSFEGFLPPVSPEAPFHMSIPKGLQTQPATLSRPPPTENKPTSSSHALAELALTGYCSSDFAAFASRLSIQTHSPERAANLSDGKVEIQPPAFDPYSEYPSSTSAPVSPIIASDTNSSVAHQPPSCNRRRMMSPVSIDMSASRSPTGSHVYHDPSAPSDRSATATMRRWTLAMSDVSDEMLVQELDRLRKDNNGRTGPRTPKAARSSQSGHGHDAPSRYPRDPTYAIVYGEPEWQKAAANFHLGDESESDEDAEDGTCEGAYEGDDPEAEEEWKTARRALLSCRELVRTERNYQARLQQLLVAESKHPLFSLMLSYVPALIEASEALLVRFVDDPSVWGVSAAFIGCEEELETALVAWCGIVGDFFSDEEDKDKRGRKPVRKAHEDSTSSTGHGEGNGRSVSRAISTFGSRSKSHTGMNTATGPPKVLLEQRRMSMFVEGPNQPRGTGMFTAALGTGLALGLSPLSQVPVTQKFRSSADVRRDNNQGAGGTISRTLSTWKRKSMPSSLSNLPAAIPLSPTPFMRGQNGYGNADTGQEKRLTVRDLAIQPSQRVTRYVLKYQGLLNHTPVTSPSRGLVERALEGALRIAKKCDRAQANPAFLRP